ncbi:MAG TPA: TIGR03619 family F420-dependent LLM class oxidoreductase [Acidimicrobiales bacterium]|nr:TIGR03619 family F420-dependent LLM class oxidoreductase [Acidimicrobiales bacterium]
MSLQLGIVTPVVQMNPRFEPPPWEEDGTIDDVVAIAVEAERLGYDWVAASEHVAVPARATRIAGPRYWDPLVTLSYVAARTSRIKLLPHVVILGFHHPLEVVKQWGTLDVLSGGRVILGLGVGAIKPEFALLGHPYEGLGARADDALRAIRAAWGEREPHYEGTHYRFADFVVDPAGERRAVDIWVGGRSRRSLRRAAELADGWIPFRLLPEDFAALLADPEIAALLDGRSSPLEMVLAPEPPLDPLADPDGAVASMRALTAVGATGLSLRFHHRSRSHYLEQLAALRDILPAVTS